MATASYTTPGDVIVEREEALANLDEVLPIRAVSAYAHHVREDIKLT